MKPRTDLLKFPHYELIVSLSSIGLPWLARGKQLTSSRTVHGTKREALRLKREIEREIDAGKARPNTEISIEQYLERWLEDEVSISNAPRTQYDYRLIVERQLIPALGRLRLRHLRAEHVLALRTKLFESGGKNGKPLSKRRVQYVLAVLKKALSDAVELGLLAENVAKRVKLPRPDRKPVEPLTESRLQMVAGAIRNSSIEAVIGLLVWTGLRRGEAMALRWQDVDLDGRTLTVAKALQRLDGQFQLVERKATHAHRKINLSQIVASALGRHRARQSQGRLLAGPEWVDDFDLVFVTKRGTPIDASNLVRAWHKLLERAGLSRSETGVDEAAPPECPLKSDKLR